MAEVLLLVRLYSEYGTNYSPTFDPAHAIPRSISSVGVPFMNVLRSKLCRELSY
jgi:hypothetical protein